MTLKYFVRLFLCFAAMLFVSSGTSLAQMKTLSDSDMADIHGQAFGLGGLELLLLPLEFSVTDPDVNGISYVRFGVNAELSLNLTIDNFRAGYYDDAVNGLGWDQDLQNLALGRSVQNSCGTGCTFTTYEDLVLDQPYFEFAVKNIDDPATREFAGARFGADLANGFISFFSNIISGKISASLATPNDVNLNARRDATFGATLQNGVNLTDVNDFWLSVAQQNIVWQQNNPNLDQDLAGFWLHFTDNVVD